MTEDRRARIENLFHRAIPLDPSERLSFLEVHCAGDLELRAEVEDLLGRDQPTEGLGIAPPFDGSEVERLPSKIGPYPIRGELGRGGMGVVYLAEDPRLGRPIALKVLPDQLAGDEERRIRFEREARLLASLNHPNVATIHSLETDGRTHFLTMERVPGVTLGRRLEAGTVELDLALALGRQIARAVEAAHENGITHRDLKPANIMVDDRSRLKVLDFGLATSGVTSAGSGVTPAAFNAGTPGYMSPELLRGQSGGPMADVFSFGCVLYELLTGQPSFPGTTAQDRIHSTLESTPDFEQLREETPDTIRSLIARTLSVDPKSRPESMAAVRRQLEEVIEERLVQTLLRSYPVASTIHPNNLPHQLTSFVGRQEDLEDTIDRLKAGRLVTLVGVGGCGKTRLALAVAKERLETFADGVFLVELSRVSEAENVPQAFLTALALEESSGKSPVETVVSFLNGKNTLLVLDNCEHLLEATAEVAEMLLRSTEGPRILATSREPFGLDGETVSVVSTLPNPPRGSSLSASDLHLHAATELFLQRAAKVNPRFEASDENAKDIAEICWRLDGIPLAIELAAARIRVLTPSELSKRLSDRFHLLTGGARSSLPQHQTLQGLIDWSFQLLDEKQQVLLRRLAIFSGGWTLEAAELVCSFDGIEGWEVLDLFTRLVDKSLVERTQNTGAGSNQARYRMLETIREFAAGRLSAVDGELEEIETRYIDFYARAAETAAAGVMGPEQDRHLRRLDADYENLRSAIGLCSRPESDPSPGFRIASSLHLYWNFRGHPTEGRAICARLLRHPGGQRTRDRARCLTVAGGLSHHNGDWGAAAIYCEESASIAREIGDRPLLAKSLTILGIVAIIQCDFPVGIACHEESAEISRELGNEAAVASSLNNLSILFMSQGDIESARRYCEESLAIRERLSTNRLVLALTLRNLGGIAIAGERYEEARRYLDRSRSLQGEDDRPEAQMDVYLGVLAIADGDLDGATTLLDRALSEHRGLGNLRGESTALHELGRLERAKGNGNSARDRFLESLSIRYRTGDTRGVRDALTHLGFVAADAGSDTDAVKFLGSASAIQSSIDTQTRPQEQVASEQALDLLRSRLGESRFSEIWSEAQNARIQDFIEGL